MESGFLFNEKLAKSLQEMARRWEANGRRFEQSSRRSPSARGSVSPVVRLVRVTSSTPGTYGYPCLVREWDGATWQEPYEEAQLISADGVATFVEDDIVPAHLSREEDDGTPIYAASPAGMAALTIREVDTSPSVAATVLELPNSAMSNPSAGVARLLEASASTGGTVTLTTQTMGLGLKTFGPIDNAAATTTGIGFGVRSQLYQFGDALPFFTPGGVLTAENYMLSADLDAEFGGTFLDSVNVPGLYQYDGVSAAFAGFDKNYQNSFTRAATFWIWDSALHHESCYGVIKDGIALQGIWNGGVMRPDMQVAGGVIVSAGSGSFFSGAAGDLTGTLDGGSF